MSTQINTQTILAIAIPLSLGLFIHDSRIYSAAVATNEKPAKITALTKDNDYTSFKELIHVNHHVHSENTTVLSASYGFGSQTPTTQPKNDSDKKYLSNKRLLGGNNNDSEYVLPTA